MKDQTPNIQKLRDSGAIVIGPQEGFQEAFLSSPADIVIGGGSAGCGKTYALLLESIRHIKIKGFTGMIFRRTMPQIFNPGGLWDTSQELYPFVGGVARESNALWKFVKMIGDRICQIAKIKFNHLEYESDISNHQGGQYTFEGFDELTHFTKKQFFYLLSRNRSACGVRPYVRATCNPDPDSWVADFISWWINQDTGFPIPERAGVLRYFIQDGEKIVWGNSPEEVIALAPHVFDNPGLRGRDPKTLVKSVTFIPGSIYENKKLLDVDPQYLGGLLSLDDASRARLLEGNWKIRQDNLAIFNYNAINDLFSNFAEASEDKFITCDAARFGRDLAVIWTWVGYKVVRIEILTTSKTTDITAAIEKERERMKIPKSKVLVDQDGVGGGVVDEGGYKGFSGDGTVLEDPKTKIKENYRNLKTQCFYRMADLVNAGKIQICLDDVVVDGRHTLEVLVKDMVFDVKKLIIDDLRAIKRKDPDRDGKKQINSKAEQKIILNGRSPDNGDTMMMRIWFDLMNEGTPGVFWL